MAEKEEKKKGEDQKESAFREEKGTPSAVWQPQTGDVLQGIFLEEFKTRNGRGYRIGNPEMGEELRPGYYVVWGGFDLDDKLPSHEPGEFLRITFLGVEEGGKKKLFRVEFRPSTKAERAIYGGMIKPRKGSDDEPY